MAVSGKRAELRAEIADGVLTIPGAEGRWHQRTSRALYVEVGDLRLHQTISVDEGVATRISRIVGKGDLRRDGLRLAGWGDVCGDLPVTVKPALPQEDGHGYVPFSCVTGFIPASDDFRTGDAWFLEAWLPPEDIDRMVAAFRAGEMRGFTIGVRPDLWMRDCDEHTPPGYGLTWYMVPMEGRVSEFPEAGRGQVNLVTWGDAPRTEPEPSTPRSTADEPFPAPDSDAVPAAAAPSPDLAGAVERLRRTVLWVGTAIAAALAIGWFV